MQNINDLIKKDSPKSKSDSSKPKISTDETKKAFDETLDKINFKKREELTQARAKTLRVEYIDLKGFPIDPEALALVEELSAKKVGVISFYFTDTEIRLGIYDFENTELVGLIKALEDKSNKVIKKYLISKNSLKFGLDQYRAVPKVKKTGQGVELTADNLKKYQNELKDLGNLGHKIQKVPLTEVVSMIVAGAIKSRASDIHIEAEEKSVKIRFRIDGVLHTIAEIDQGTWPKIASRIKLLSKLKINITNTPQDGRFTVRLDDNETIDMRVSCLPTSYGESIVIRLLKSSDAGLAFDSLGLRGKAFEQLSEQITRPNGMILTTGPTGSGKTTLLYAILNKLNTSDNKIITVEDPVEYKLKGINQSQIEADKDYTFAKGLKAILRQDPDIVMVGEIRDLETADIAVNAALTGHLVVSTLHTNDAAGAIPRFLSLGMKPFLLAPAVNAIVAQRLVRRICENCREEYQLSEEEKLRTQEIINSFPEELSEYKKKELKFYHGKGCSKCAGLGYHGRIGIYEVLLMGSEIEKLILAEKVSEFEMRDVARAQGMITMIQDGIIKAIEGIVSLEEIFKATEEK